MSYSDLKTVAAESVSLLEHDPHPASESEQGFETWLPAFETESRETLSEQTAIASNAREILFEGTLCINGYVAGTIRSGSGSLVVEANGLIDADIFVKDAIIHGHVRGDIHAREAVLLSKSARVIGDIASGALSLEPGAVFEGHCTFLKPTDPTES